MESPIQTDFRGQKLAKFPLMQQVVVSWCYDNPKISDYEISKRLFDRYEFKFSSPSVKSWRENFLPELLKKIRLDIPQIDSSIPQEEYTYIDYIKMYQALLTNVEDGMKVVSEARQHRFKVADGKTTYLDQQLEKSYQDYIRIKTDLYEKLLKYVPKDSPWKIAEEAIKECAMAIVLSLRDLINDPTYQHRIAVLQEELAKVESKLRDKYFITI